MNAHGAVSFTEESVLCGVCDFDEHHIANVKLCRVVAIKHCSFHSICEPSELALLFAVAINEHKMFAADFSFLYLQLNPLKRCDHLR